MRYFFIFSQIFFKISQKEIFFLSIFSFFSLKFYFFEKNDAKICLFEKIVLSLHPKGKYEKKNENSKITYRKF